LDDALRCRIGGFTGVVLIYHHLEVDILLQIWKCAQLYSAHKYPESVHTLPNETIAVHDCYLPHTNIRKWFKHLWINISATHNLIPHNNIHKSQNDFRLKMFATQRTRTLCLLRCLLWCSNLHITMDDLQAFGFIFVQASVVGEMQTKVRECEPRCWVWECESRCWVWECESRCWVCDWVREWQRRRVCDWVQGESPLVEWKKDYFLHLPILLPPP